MATTTEYKTDPERLAKLETRTENIELVVTRMDAKMDTWQANFVSKEVLEDKLKLRDERIERLEDEKSTNKHTLPLWVAAAISAISLIVIIWPHVH